MAMSEQGGGFWGQYLTPIAVLLAAAIIAVALIFSGVRGTNPNDPNAERPQIDVSEIATDSPTVGDVNAPQTIALFYDYQCPFCKQFELEALDQLSDLIDSGQVKIVYKDFHFLGEDSLTAALFGRALYDLYPDRFGEWMVAMMEAQDEEGDQGFGDLASIRDLTASLEGIDVGVVVSKMNENQGEYQAAIQADYQEGLSLGINGTPSIVVGNQLLTGMSPAQFVAAIRAELEQ